MQILPAQRSWLAVAVFALGLTSANLASQVPTQGLPSPEQAEQLLRTRPDLVKQLQSRINSSGLTPEQIRARLRAAGYPEDMLDAYMGKGDTTGVALSPGTDIIEATRTLGLIGGEEVDSLLMLTDSARAIADSLRADSLAREEQVTGPFGMSLFRRASTLFTPPLSGPVDANYRLGPGDGLVLLLTGDVELAHQLTVTREGFIVIPQVGQLNVANLTLGQLEDMLYARLSRVYSGVKRGAGATTRFNVTVARLRTVQVFVTGDVARPGSFQISAASTVLSALYAGGGPTENGSFRRIEVHRGGTLLDTLDLYDYLLRGDSQHDRRLETGDVVFVPVRGAQVRVAGKVVRPALYELKPGESLRDLIQAAGGFEADALRRRVQVDRILPPAQRQPGGRDRVVLELGSDQFEDGMGPAFPLAAGDSVTVFSIVARRRNMVTVNGNVWTPGDIGYSPGMRLSDAIRLAGGPKPDVFLGQVLVARLQSDSTYLQLRSGFRDSTGVITNDFLLQEDDEITVYSRTSFRPERYVAVTGAVRKGGRVAYREGMTLRDALLEAGGLTEDALLTEAEIARMPDDSLRSVGGLASTFRAPLDSTYLFDRDPSGRYLGPPGRPAPASGAAEVSLKPYDNILVLRQPEWELQRSVSITGEVKFPGRYALLSKTERLIDLVDRAGGFTKQAYPGGVRFYRRVDRGGRIGIDLPTAVKDPTFRDNLILADGDSIHIPEYIPVIYVAGEVNSPISVSYVPGKDIDYYVQSAGGLSKLGDSKRLYVTQPNGKVQSVKRKWWFFPDSKPKPQPGGIVFAPEKDPADKKDWIALAASIAGIVASVTTTLIIAFRY
jgi:polysaccharide export outer membrane protein